MRSARWAASSVQAKVETRGTFFGVAGDQLLLESENGDDALEASLSSPS